MKTLVYEKRLGRYELASYSNKGGDKVKIILGIPADAKITVENKVYALRGGILVLPLKELPIGEVHPKLYLDGRIYELEGFTVGGGIIAPIAHSDEYIRRLGGICEELRQRTAMLEGELAAVKDKISAPLNF